MIRKKCKVIKKFSKFTESKDNFTIINRELELIN
jgi:hypothetical protein